MEIGSFCCIFEKVTHPFRTAVSPKYDIIRKRLQRSVALNVELKEVSR